MKKSISSARSRRLHTIHLRAELVVIGGGVAGVCAAITAARTGTKVVLIQDRPVLGGNASSEVRLWILGATSHMGNNNRWAREGGVIDEILVENLYRNSEGNPCVLDALLLELVDREANVELLLNTAVFDLDKNGADHISGVRAFCSQNARMYRIEAPLYCDASGDGIVGFLSGAAFRMGSESKQAFGELLGAEEANENLLGHSIYFYSKDTGKPVTFVPPAFALKDISCIPRFREFKTAEYGCRLWWIEYGGHLDTIDDSEKIKWELWRIVYGVWDYIKNSKAFPDAENLTLEWVGTIPGKRESRRFEGDYMLTQQDIVEQRTHFDAVAFGGWAIDLHPVDGVFSENPGCTQWHSKGIYQIPYRCLYSRNIDNLFFAGRIISASHIAFGSTRVMATCGYAAQAVGQAAALCIEKGCLPRALATDKEIEQLQIQLNRTGQFIPNLKINDGENLAAKAQIKVSSHYVLSEMKPNGSELRLDCDWAMMVPVDGQSRIQFTFWARAQKPEVLRVELLVSEDASNFTPESCIENLELELTPSDGFWEYEAIFNKTMEESRYLFIVFRQNEAVKVRCSQDRVTGVLSLRRASNPSVAKAARQEPPVGIGIDPFDFWLPQRRPLGQNIGLRFHQPLALSKEDHLVNGMDRPVLSTNAWIADKEDPQPSIELSWEQPVSLSQLHLAFDNDFDHPMESVLMGHPERIIPYCISAYRIYDETNALLVEVTENHQTRRVHHLSPPLITRKLRLEFDAPGDSIPAAVMGLRAYSV